MNINHQALKSIAQDMDAAIREAIQSDETTANLIYEHDGFCIEIEANIYDDTYITVTSYNDDKIGQPYPNVEDAIREVLPSWDDVRAQLEYECEDEWQAHGFRNAADYYNYRYG